MTGTGGDIYIWDAHTGSMLHQIPRLTETSDLTCIACHQFNDAFVFASGTPTGSIHIWAKRGETQANLDQEESPSSVG